MWGFIGRSVPIRREPRGHGHAAEKFTERRPAHAAACFSSFFRDHHPSPIQNARTRSHYEFIALALAAVALVAAQSTPDISNLPTCVLGCYATDTGSSCSQTDL
jgi:hypothetical protein